MIGSNQAEGLSLSAASASAGPPAATLAAVLTGDLIGSTAAAPADLERAMRAIAEAAAAVASWPGGADARFTRFRGDGWQMRLADPARAPRAALVIVARLAATRAGGLATRVAIGLGRIDSLGGADLADARGPALEASGRGLDAMPRGRRLAIAGEGVDLWRRVVLDLLDERSSRWSPEQAEALAEALSPAAPRLADIAAPLGVSPQAINQRLAAAGAPAIRRSLAAWEEAAAGEAG